MRISYEWLGDFLDTAGLTPQAAADLLTMSGTKIESVEITDLSAIVIGRVLEQREHPKSRNPLWIHQVDMGGGEVRQIIAGAPNAGPGTLVPVALPGTVVPNGTEVRDARIAGEVGQGMLCSAAELNLGDDHGGILLLPEGEPGSSLALLYPTDAIFEAEITPNRPDCLGHLGIARELAAAAGRELTHDFMPPFTGGIDPAGSELISVSIENTGLCRRYIGGPISGVTVAPSPAWLQRRLRAAGVRPISNLVDVTAYVMLEYGQPLHVFDRVRLAGPEIRVRNAQAGETLLCLDGQRRALSGEMLVIADAERPVAIAGLIGGLESAVTETTREVLLEAATFDGVNIRATSRALHLRTEASSRFEKDLSPELALAAARRAATLISELAAGSVHRDWVDQYPRPQEPIRVTLPPAEIDALLGVHIPLEESEGILRRLGFHVRVLDDGIWDVLPPVFRLDIGIPEDVVEEVGRIHGIERIPPTLPGRRRSSWQPASTGWPDWRLREVLLGAGFDETVSPALVAGRLLQRLGLGEGARSVTNPMSDEADTMRTSLLPSLLQVLVLNQNRSGSRPAVFELARVYQGTLADGLAGEATRLTAVARTVSGSDAGRAGFLRLKAVAVRLAQEFGMPEPRFEAAAPGLYHPGRTARVVLGGEPLGWVGELHPEVVQAFGLDGRVVALDLAPDALLGSVNQRRAEELPRFPAATRDIAVVVAESAPAEALIATIREAGGELVESVVGFDEFRSDQIGAGLKSLAFSLTFRASERTLTDSEVDQQMNVILRRLETDHGARGR